MQTLESIREEFYKKWINKPFTYEELADFFLQKIKERNQDIQSVLNMLDGDTDRKQIANYIRKYLALE